jgi:hypothetical protein
MKIFKIYKVENNEVLPLIEKPEILCQLIKQPTYFFSRKEAHIYKRNHIVQPLNNSNL